MKRVLLFSCLLFSSLNAMRTSQEQFELRKSRLPAELQSFINDFHSWPSEDKAKFFIVGLSFVVSGLSIQQQTQYGGNIGLWIDRHTQTKLQRENFIYCLMHLQER